jgi:hypothetical protein
MRCANPECSAELVYLRGGSVQLLELEPDLSGSGDQENYEFSTHTPPRRFFWLCDACSHSYMVKRWTPVGIVLEPRNGRTSRDSVPPRHAIRVKAA